VPQNIINALADHTVGNLHLITSNAGSNNYGIYPLIKANKVAKITTSSIDECDILQEQLKAGKIDVEFVPLGILSEKIRSGGFGIPAFYSTTGYGTEFQKGKETKTINGKSYVLEHTILADIAIVKAWKADTKGNSIFRKCSINYNPDAGMGGRFCIVEAEEIVEVGALNGDDIHLSGVFVHRVVKSTNSSCPNLTPKNLDNIIGEGEMKTKRETIIKRAAQEIKDGMYVHLGRGLPKLARKYLHPKINADFFTENGIIGATDKGEDILDEENIMGSIQKGGVAMKASDAYALLRSGKLDLIISEGLQVSANGDLSNVKNGSMHSMYDLCASNTPIVVIMEQLNAEGMPNLVKSCTMPLNGVGVVSKLITEMGVFKFLNGKPMLVELAKGVDVATVKKSCGCEISVCKCLPQ